MTEVEAREWFQSRFDPSAITQLEAFATRLAAATSEQNLIAASTVPELWSRHLVDSAQLLSLAPQSWSHWVDIGSGAGLPGLVVAILSTKAVTLIEPRQLRVQFLQSCADALSLTNVTVVHGKAAAADIERADVVSARAVASLSDLLDMSSAFSSRSTRFILPKGKSANSEVAEARRKWHGSFHVEHSIVDPTSGIVVASNVARR